MSAHQSALPDHYYRGYCEGRGCWRLRLQGPRGQSELPGSPGPSRRALGAITSCERTCSAILATVHTTKAERARRDGGFDYPRFLNPVKSPVSRLKGRRVRPHPKRSASCLPFRASTLGHAQPCGRPMPHHRGASLASPCLSSRSRGDAAPRYLSARFAPTQPAHGQTRSLSVPATTHPAVGAARSFAQVSTTGTSLSPSFPCAHHCLAVQLLRSARLT